MSEENGAVSTMLKEVQELAEKFKTEEDDHNMMMYVPTNIWRRRRCCKRRGFFMIRPPSERTHASVVQ